MNTIKKVAAVFVTPLMIGLAGQADAGDFKAKVNALTAGAVEQTIKGGRASFKESTVNAVAGGTVLNARQGGSDRTDIDINSITTGKVSQNIDFDRMRGEKSTLNFLAAGTAVNLY